MSFTAIITLTGTVGADAGPFNLYSDVDSYATPFESSISKSALVAGYTSTSVPNLTSVVRVKSIGTCTNHIDIAVNNPTVAVYSRCTDAFIAYINASITASPFAQDGGALCYQKIDEGLLTAMEAAYPGMTNVTSLVSSSCRCV
jgi:hypothetical protein